MSLGNNRDYKTNDRRVRKNLAKHAAIMNSLKSEFNMPTLEASSLAFKIMEGKESYPEKGRNGRNK